MNQDVHTILDAEIAVYHGGGAARCGWIHAGLALCMTFGIFALLPFSEIVSTPPKRTLDIRRIDTVLTQIEPPRLEKPEPPPPPPDEQPQHEVEAKPELVVPQENRKRKLDLGVTLDLGLDLGGDFHVDFALTPQDAPTVPAAPVAVPKPEPTPSVYTLDQVDTPPRQIVTVRPVYPYRARSRGIEGFVEIAFTVTVDGRVVDIKVVSAEREDLFGTDAKRAVARGRFEPGIKDGKKVPVLVRQTVRFELK